jgi:hypothetical protein
VALFGRKKEDRTEKAMRQAEDIAAGKGLTGKLMKGFMGAENAAQLGAAVGTARQAQEAAALQAQGLPTINATVVQLADTGQLINFDPVVVIVATLENGQQINFQTLVSKLQIPRPGDRILVMQHPQQPGQFIYGGLALN